MFKMKSIEKEKRQLDIKLDKLDRLCRTLQQERTNLQTTVKDLSKSSTISMENDSSNLAKGIFSFKISDFIEFLLEASISKTDNIMLSTVLTMSSEIPTNVHDS